MALCQAGLKLCEISTMLRVKLSGAEAANVDETKESRRLRSPSDGDHMKGVD